MEIIFQPFNRQTFKSQLQKRRLTSLILHIFDPYLNVFMLHFSESITAMRAMTTSNSHSPSL